MLRRGMRGGSVVHVQLVRATVPRRRGVRPRVACWKTTWVGPRRTGLGYAITQLGTGLFDADHFEDALPVFEATLSMKRRLGATEQDGLARRAILRMRTPISDGSKRPCACGKTCILDG